ncbi:MAG: hypothetical protein HKN86_03790 [Acidimicrobiia bacterium]|nr:hypothetical protein [Acidimicrobiia bacterium]
MSENIKAEALDVEEKSIAEKEADVQKPSTNEDGDYTVNLGKINQPKEETNAVQEQETEDGVLRGSGEDEKDGEKAEVGLQEVQQEKVEEPVLEEVIEEEVPKEQAPVTEEKQADTVEEIKEPEVNLPENIQDLVKFMEETGGTLEDYVRLSADYSNVDENTLLREYYKQTKPHLSYDEVSFLLDDQFSFDAEIDEERDIKRKKLALKEEVANANKFLNETKEKYYKEVKLGSKLAPEQQKAIDFFDRYNKEQQLADELLKQQTSHFKQETSKVFNEEFKGFNFNVGDKKYRFNVKDVNKVKETQGDLLNVFNKYVGDNKMLQDAGGYHKALFAASNPDKIANHFYEQGKADAIKQLSAEAKNINMDPRKTSSGYVEAGGIKVKAISGEDNSKLKFKLKNY